MPVCEKSRQTPSRACQRRRPRRRIRTRRPVRRTGQELFVQAIFHPPQRTATATAAAAARFAEMPKARQIVIIRRGCCTKVIRPPLARVSRHESGKNNGHSLGSSLPCCIPVTRSRKARLPAAPASPRLNGRPAISVVANIFMPAQQAVLAGIQPRRRMRSGEQMPVYHGNVNRRCYGPSVFHPLTVR